MDENKNVFNNNPIENPMDSTVNGASMGEVPSEQQETSGQKDANPLTNESTNPTGNLYGQQSSDGSYSYVNNQPSTPPQQQTAYNHHSAYGAAQQTNQPTQANGYYAQGTAQPTSQSGQGSYTWTAPQYTPAKQKKEKQKSGWGKTIVAMLLCCIITAGATMGIFTYMANSGRLQIQGSGSETRVVANKVIDDTKNSTVNTITGELTTQEVAEKLIPSVVCIQTYAPQSQNYLFGGGFDSGDADETMITPLGQGSGIVYTKEGHIVTNAHVIEGATKIKIVTSDGLTYEAELIGADTATDLAVIKVNADIDLQPAEFGVSEDLKVADEVMAVGNPGGIQFNSSVTIGYVSALNREVTNEENGYTMACIQTDAAINPGNSGGALVDMYGYVIGINSSKIVATGYEGLGFAIPIDTALPIIQNLMDYGYVKDRAMLGISVQYVDSLTARFYGLTEGMYVARLNSEEALKSGIEVGDVITAIDGTPITSSNTISTFLANKKPGETVTLKINRAETQQQMDIELVLSENTGE